MRVVLDTNVVVSAQLTPHGSSARVLELALQGKLDTLHDARILAEYREVLARPKFGFDPDDIDDVVGQLERGGASVLALPVSIELPDADDLIFLEVAIAGNAAALVTGNPRHFERTSGAHRITIISPTELLARLADR